MKQLLNGSEYLKRADRSDINIPIRLKNIIKQKEFKSELQFYNYLEELINKYTSIYLFPNNYVAFYPYLISHKASSTITCDISNAKINIGSNYISYRPLIENLTTNTTYTINKTIKAEPYYYDYFPQTLCDFEIWYQKLINFEYCNDDIIDFYNISINCGDNCLSLRKFNKRR